MKFADLHLHTHYSDGSYTPDELLDEAGRQDLSVIAVTDHDTVKGSDQAELISKEYGVEVIPGVEMTTSAGEKEYHILGYFMDKKNDKFLSKLSDNQSQRYLRMKKMVEKLNEFGVKFDFEELIISTGEVVLGRLHLANFLMKKKIVSSRGEAFERYIGNNRPCFVKGKYISTAEAVRLIKEAGGVPVWAHPGLSYSEFSFNRLLNWGIQGIEVLYPKHSDDQIGAFTYLCNKYGLFITGGSDCHGKKKDRPSIGAVKLPHTHIQSLREGAFGCV